MKIEQRGDTLSVSGVKELGATSANGFRDSVRAAVTESQRNIDVDLSETTFIDSCGLGALISLHKTAIAREGKLRLLNPQPPVLQILELTRMHRLFEITRT